jgi:cytosine/creatinine deaminase
MDEFLKAAVAEAEAGLAEGGIPIGSVLVHGGQIIGRGHNRRVQRSSAILHGEMDALENAGRLPAAVYTRSVCTRPCLHAPCARGRFCCTASHASWSARTSRSGARKTYCGTEAWPWTCSKTPAASR